MLQSRPVKLSVILEDRQMTSLPYYVRESWGIGTNLQLHSLRKAWRCWLDLRSKKYSLSESRIRERCVIIVDLLGLSLSQLLGQNVAIPSKRVPPPQELLPSFLNQTGLPKQQKTSVIKRFNQFLAFYDDCRHFGTPKHVRIDRLSLQATEAFLNLAIEIWDLVIDHFRRGRESSLQFKSVRDILEKDEEYEEEIDV